MTWAARRRLIIVGTIVLVVLIVLVGAFYKTFLSKAPSCVDGIQNQGEQGIDCGGPCPYLCTALEESPVVRFTQALPSGNGTTDVIAYIDNPNTTAYARSVPYTVTLYGSDDTLAAGIIHGTVDLPAGATMPVFIPNINSGKTLVESAFLTIDPSAPQWQAGRDTRVLPVAASATLGGTSAAPRITATLDNPSAVALTNVKVIVALFDASGNAVAASQTILPSIPAQGNAIATFTWNAPFSEAPTHIDVLPVIPLAGSS
jgi:hypothetical protein